jgi:hypothetical protein
MTNMPAHRWTADRGPADYPPITRPMESTGLARSDAAALADLQVHWGSVYEIGLDGDIWSATFRGSADELRAHTCLELRTLVRADYSYRQQAGHTRHRSAADTGAADAGEPPPESYGHPPTGGERMSL